MPMPPIGLRHRESVTVDASLTVPSVSPSFRHFHDMPPVFATAFMVGFVEETCVAALEAHLGRASARSGPTSISAMKRPRRSG